MTVSIQYEIEIPSDRPKTVAILPPKSKLERTNKIALVVISAGLGFIITFPATIPDWSNTFSIITNIGVLLAFGTVDTWGIFMSGYEAGRSIQESLNHPMSCYRISGKIAQVVFSAASGAFAQLPDFEIARRFHGSGWGVATELCGMWVPTYSQYALIETIEKKIIRSPRLAKTLNRKLQLILAGKLEVLFKNVLFNLRLSTDSERNLIFQKWSLTCLIPVQENRLQTVYKELLQLSKHLYAQPPLRSHRSHTPRLLFQISAVGSTSLYFLQSYLLSQEAWEDVIESEPLKDTLSAFSVIPLSFYVLKGAWVSCGHIYDLVGDLFGCEREQSFQETHFKKLSRILYLMGLAIAILPQGQTVEIAKNNYNPDTPFGTTFLAANILGTVLFIYITAKEIIDIILLEILDHGLVNNEAAQIARRIEIELNEAIENLYDQPFDALYALIHDIPNSEIKLALLDTIDERKLKELIPIFADQQEEEMSAQEIEEPECDLLASSDV